MAADLAQRGRRRCRGRGSPRVTPRCHTRAIVDEIRTVIGRAALLPFEGQANVGVGAVCVGRVWRRWSLSVSGRNRRRFGPPIRTPSSGTGYATRLCNQCGGRGESRGRAAGCSIGRYGRAAGSDGYGLREEGAWGSRAGKEEKE